jgi:hypothetical protein
MGLKYSIKSNGDKGSEKDSINYKKEKAVRKRYLSL